MTVVYSNRAADVTEKKQMPLTSFLKLYHAERATKQPPRGQEPIKQSSPYC